MDTGIDRSADVLERAGSDVEAISREVFGQRATRATLDADDFQSLQVRIGRKNDLISKIRESLISLPRVLTFIQTLEVNAFKDFKNHLRTMSRDLHSLNDHTAYLADKLSFLLEATLGMISHDQNRIIKILAAVASVFLPPRSWRAYGA